MLPAGLTRMVVKSLDALAEHFLAPDERPEHQQTGSRGEVAAYFHLRKLGYLVVARNFRTPGCPGEIDLIAWDHDGHQYTSLTKSARLAITVTGHWK